MLSLSTHSCFFTAGAALEELEDEELLDDDEELPPTAATTAPAASFHASASRIFALRSSRFAFHVACFSCLICSFCCAFSYCFLLTPNDTAGAALNAAAAACYFSHAFLLHHDQAAHGSNGFFFFTAPKFSGPVSWNCLRVASRLSECSDIPVLPASVITAVRFYPVWNFSVSYKLHDVLSSASLVCVPVWSLNVF